MISIKDFFSKVFLNKIAKDKQYKIIKTEQETNRNDLIYKTGNKKGESHLVFQNIKQYDFLGEIS